MQVKVMETGQTETIEYRSWNGVRYGPDESAEIIKQYQEFPLDRASQAYILSFKNFRFWQQYFKHLEKDERDIRVAYQKYNVIEVEKALKDELKKVGDDPALHHKARRNALKFIELSLTVRSERHKLSYYLDEGLTMRFSALSDQDLIEVLKAAELEKVPKGRTVKEYMRLGIKYKHDQAKALQDDVDLLKQKGWL